MTCAPDPVTGRNRTDAVVEDVLAILLRHRRAPRDEPAPERSAFDPQRAQIRAAVTAGTPLRLVLPAFPCKSPNPAKVLGRLPDAGERLSLHHLDRIRAEIAAVHEPGARVLVCSDGHVFADLIGVPDPHVDDYGAALRDLAAAERLPGFEFFDLAHAYPGRSHDERRVLLDRLWAPTVEQLRQRCRTDPSERALYLGIVRFLVEDAADHEGSRAALQRRSRERAYRVVARSNAWSALVADRFPDGVRLSIHPHPAGSSKLGVRLVRADDAWTTPWHSCAVRGRDGTWSLQRADRARRSGRLVGRAGLPDHIACAESLRVSSDSMPDTDSTGAH
ncbi:L-tyrosine/L-tryptophan isonitrile synthase family protein [Pseudonocardia sp. ICBG1122]|nr:L-tyrosine/L-tryptophan isonitrile synthase family protein [Pseudonocardia pini]